MCQSGEKCLPAYFCIGELALYKINCAYWYSTKQTSSLSRGNVTHFVLNNNDSLRERPFNLKGLWFFSKKNILIPNVAEKNILILVEGKKKKSDSEFLSYNLMLNSGKKNSRSARQKNKYSNSCVVRKKISEQNKKP